MRERGLKHHKAKASPVLALSLPMRERGLKHCMLIPAMKERDVAPHAGAWIETTETTIKYMGKLVAPHAGAWIETHSTASLPFEKKVAPHAGAWIETCTDSRNIKTNRSRSPCGSVD